MHFQPEEPGLTVLMHRGEAPFERVGGFRRGWWTAPGYAPVYSRLCDAPCAVRLAPGEYQLALSKNGGPPVPASDPVDIGQPSSVHSEYVDRSGVRTVGWIIDLAGAVGGVVMIAASSERESACDAFGDCYWRQTFNGDLLAGGVGVIVGSAIVGTILASQRDEAHLTVEPLTLPFVGGAREPSMARASAQLGPSAHGASLALHF